MVEIFMISLKKNNNEVRKSVIGHRDDYTTNTRSINESSNSIGKKY